MKEYRVLVADDDEAVRELIKCLLQQFDFTILEAKNGKEAMDIIEKEKPDILVTDVDMPHISGFEICRKVKGDKKYGFIYVLIVTGSSRTSEDREKGFDYGADDYICKPFDDKEFTGRIKAALRIKKLHDEIFDLSITDELTSLYNRRYFNKLVSEEFYRAERYKRNVSCLMLDIDHFKKINDTYGHEGGDYILKEISKILTGSLRQSDKTCRFGGEEFVVFLPETNGREAELAAENLRKEIEKSEFNYRNNRIPVTVSIGFASFMEGPVKKSEDLMAYADKALYKAKEDGRNCTRQIFL